MKELLISKSIILFALLLFSCSEDSKTVETSEVKNVIDNNLTSSNAGLQDSIDDNQVYVSVAEDLPDFPGGLEGLKNFLLQNVEYPTTAERDSIEGMVVLNFIIRESGSIDNIEVVRSVRKDLDMAGVAAVRKMPNWGPAKIKGKPVAIRYTLPIRFELNKTTKSEQIIKNFDFKIYPNPAKESVFISVSDDCRNCDYQIYDLMGKIVLAGKLAGLENEVKLYNLAENTYLIRVFSKDQKTSKTKSLIVKN